jgi:hypothetical protein
MKSGVLLESRNDTLDDDVEYLVRELQKRGSFNLIFNNHEGLEK